MKNIYNIYTAILLFCTMFISHLNAQTCTKTSNIPPNGTVTINGIAITPASTGSVSPFASSFTSCSAYTTSTGSLHVGQTGQWQVTFTFDKPVNGLIILLNATGHSGNEDFNFYSDKGDVSISSTSNCYTTINGNSILSGQGAPANGGGGIFKISAPSAFKKLTINGNGNNNGSLMAICESSIVEAPCAAGITQVPLNGTALTNQ